jgi:hypothetical protein
MDITGQLLERWCAQSGVELTNVMQDSFVELTRTNEALRIGFGIVKRNLRGPGTIDTGDGIAVVSWEEIRQAMREVRRQGKLKKDKSSGVEYLEIE